MDNTLGYQSRNRFSGLSDDTFNQSPVVGGTLNPSSLTHCYFELGDHDPFSRSQ